MSEWRDQFIEDEIMKSLGTPTKGRCGLCERVKLVWSPDVDFITMYLCKRCIPKLIGIVMAVADDFEASLREMTGGSK